MQNNGFIYEEIAIWCSQCAQGGLNECIQAWQHVGTTQNEPKALKMAANHQKSFIFMHAPVFLQPQSMVFGHISKINGQGHFWTHFPPLLAAPS